MNYTEIRKLVKLVEESKISELEIEEENSRVRILKHPVKALVEQAPEIVVQPPVATEIPVLPAPELPTNQADVDSPMVGTFYRAPSPEAPSYVQIGDRVKPGQVLCIIEAMKLMNEIEAEVAGRVAEISVENAQPVEYGQRLFKIELD